MGNVRYFGCGIEPAVATDVILYLVLLAQASKEGFRVGVVPARESDLGGRGGTAAGK